MGALFSAVQECVLNVNWLFQNRRKVYERYGNGENKRRIFPEKRNLDLVSYRSFSGNYREIQKVLKWKTAVFFTFPTRRRKKTAVIFRKIGIAIRN